MKEPRFIEMNVYCSSSVSTRRWCCEPRDPDFGAGALHSPLLYLSWSIFTMGCDKWQANMWKFLLICWHNCLIPGSVVLRRIETLSFSYCFHHAQHCARHTVVNVRGLCEWIPYTLREETWSQIRWRLLMMTRGQHVCLERLWVGLAC